MRQSAWLTAIAVLNMAAAASFYVLAAALLTTSRPGEAWDVIAAMGVPMVFLGPLLPILLLGSAFSSKALTGVIFLFLGGLTTSVGIGLWKRKDWARRWEIALALSCMALFVGGGVFDLFFVFSPRRSESAPPLLGLVGLAGIAVAIVWYLLRPPTKHAFGVPAQGFSRARWAVLLAIGLLSAVLVFGYFIWTMGKALGGLK